MAYKANILLGQITKVHGFKGAVTVRLEKTFTENIPELESVFIEIEGKPVPFFISWSEYPGGNIIWIKLSGYESIDKVSEYTGSRIFLKSDESGLNTPENLQDLKGFKINSGDNKIIGTITSLIENPGQVLLNVETGKGKEILIPLHENLIISVDRRRKIIKMDLPEGLIELNS
jgi:16S rRNA processing protein RimM